MIATRQNPRYKRSCIILTATLASACQAFNAAHAQQVGQSTDEILDEIIVRGIRGGLRDALNQKRESDTFMDAIVAEDIGKLPDDNIAETLARVPGVQLERESGEGVNITIRGIRENRTEVNGRTLISPSGRGTNEGLFSYLPSELAGSVKVSKFLTADMADGALGGTVDIITRKPLDYDGLWGGATVKRSYTDLNDDYGTRASTVFSSKFKSDTMGVLLGLVYEDRPVTEDRAYSGGAWRADTTIPAGWTLPDTSNNYIYYLYDLAYQRKRETREKAALNAAFQWKPSDRLDINVDATYGEYEYDRSRGWMSIQLNHPRDRKVSDPIISEHNHLIGGVVSDSITSTAHEGYQLSRSFITGGVNATWTFNNGAKLFTEFAHTKADEIGDQQYLRMYARMPAGAQLPFYFGGGEVPVVDTSVVNLNPLDATVDVMYDNRTLNEGAENSFRMDLDLPLNGLFTRLKAGVRVSDITTDMAFIAKRGVTANPRTGAPVDWNTAEATSLQRAGIVASRPQDLPWVMAALRPFALSGVLSGTGVTLPPQMTVIDSHLIGNGAFGFSDAFYDAPFEKFPERTSNVQDRVAAAYVRGDFEFAGWVGNIGIRYADTETAIDNFALVNAAYVPYYKKGGYADVLPSIVVKKDLTDDLVFRFGAGATITRPPARILGEVARVNYVLDDPNTPENESDSSSARLPNPDLKPQRGKNFDASLEWYFSESSAVALGLFYKTLDNQIDTSVRSGTIDGYGDQIFRITTATNISGGWIRGFEIAYQQEFRFLPGLLRNTGASINYTFLESETDDIEPRTGERLPIQGMSENSINAQLYYEDSRLSARVLYNWRDEYYDALDPFSRLTAIWSKGVPSLDASIRYRIGKSLKLEFQAVNILNTPNETFAGFEEYLASYSVTGVRYSLGLSLKL